MNAHTSLTREDAFARITDRRSQLEKLVAVSRAIEGAMHDAGKGNLWVSRSGAVLANALYDLTDCQELYELRRETEFNAGITADGEQGPVAGERAMSAPLTVAEVLERAADLIEPEGAWAQHGYNPRKGCYCALGAIAKVAVGDIRGNWKTPEMAFAREAAERVFGHLNTLVEFNDGKDRKQAEVVSVLRRAAKIARAGRQA